MTTLSRSDKGSTITPQTLSYLIRKPVSVLNSPQTFLNDLLTILAYQNADFHCDTNGCGKLIAPKDRKLQKQITKFVSNNNQNTGDDPTD